MLLWLGLHGTASAGFAEGAEAYREHNYAMALKEITPLARAGHADAQHLLGLMYYMGRGVPRDDRQAFEWDYKAAQQGIPAAEYVIGAMYYTGRAVPQDQKLAVSWFRKAAEHGEPDAQYALGLMARHHVAGMPENSVAAYMLWSLAAARGHRKAGEQRDDLARHMTGRQINEAQTLSRNWRPGMPLP